MKKLARKWKNSPEDQLSLPTTEDTRPLDTDEWVAVIACSLAVDGLLHDSKYGRRWIWHSFFAGIALAFFWLYYMLRIPRFRWDVIWLLLGPLSGAGISLYADHLLRESSEEIRKLRGYMYAYKTR